MCDTHKHIISPLQLSQKVLDAVQNNAVLLESLANSSTGNPTDERYSFLV